MEAGGIFLLVLVGSLIVAGIVSNIKKPDPKADENKDNKEE